MRIRIAHPIVRVKTFHFGAGKTPIPAPPAASPPPKSIAHLPLSEFQRARLSAKIAAVTCSQPWAEVAATGAERAGIDPGAGNLTSQLAIRGIYPPAAELGPHRLPRVGAVRMRRCDGCGRIVPPINIASHRLVRLCDDCRIEPDVDPDEIDQKPTPERAPGAQLHVLVGEVIEKHANREAARNQLHQIGLTDPEITAMALTYAGCSTRQVANLNQWSQTYVRKLLRSSTQKLRRSHLVVPKPHRDGTCHRPTTIDPVKLDGMTERICDRVP